MINRIKEFLNKHKIMALIVFVYIIMVIIIAIFIPFSSNKLFLGILIIVCSILLPCFLAIKQIKQINEIASNNKEIIRLTRKGEELYNEQIKLYEEQIKLLTEKNEILKRRHAMLATGIPLEIAEYLNDKK